MEDEWGDELVTKPKLAFLRLLKEKGGESQCLDVAYKCKRRYMMMIRGRTALHRIECGRWRGLERDERTCRECNLGKVEDVQRWLLEYEKGNDKRAELFLLLSRISPDFNFALMTDNEELFMILDQGCKHHSILRIIDVDCLI